MATNYPSLLLLNNHHECPDRCVPPSLMSYRELRVWSRFFKELVTEAIKDSQSWELGE